MTYHRVSSSMFRMELKLKEEGLGANYKYSRIQRCDAICAYRERFKLLQSYPETPYFRLNLWKDNETRMMRMLIIEDSPIIIEVRSGRSSSFGCCNILGPGGYFATRKAMSWRETSMTRLWERLSYTELTEDFCTKHEK